ncbi:hypothetical protein EUGRSUZ_J01290 [Eucalyptus grandis]|uniref:Uncharacterized protein n=2 Tax=Eucalyptus grandis TaxID=71139 RepID=A0ACC3JYD0_EUCGR|nr:hypothetical protein EUGRSUZ_J01290 [Eucalyptus grandis]
MPTCEDRCVFISIRMERSFHRTARVHLENAEFVVLAIFGRTLSSAYVNILFELRESNNWAINPGNNMLQHSLELAYCRSNFKARLLTFLPLLSKCFWSCKFFSSFAFPARNRGSFTHPVYCMDSNHSRRGWPFTQTVIKTDTYYDFLTLDCMFLLVGFSF